MNKQVLALDCDGVLFNWHSGFIKFCLNNGYQLDVNSKFDQYNMSSWFVNMLDSEFYDLAVEYNRIEHPPMFDYLRNCLPQLQQKYEVVIVSSYSDDEDAQLRRKNALLALMFNNVFLLNLGESKQEILEEIKPDIFVDDSPKHLQEGLDAGIERVIAIEYPYNVRFVENVTHGQVETIKTLEELL